LRWQPGSTVRIAFLGGSNGLRRQIAEATQSITTNGNLKFDFGHNPANGTYRSWSTSDTQLAAEIRVSFDQAGYSSLVGRDSVNGNIGGLVGPVGGRPNQRSLNLGGFRVQLPSDWKRTVRHEFLHAVAFHHEHQSPLGGCDSQFRWEDDPGYVLTQDAFGRFISANGKRPGIYTYLSGYPNFWNRQKVDFNLRQVSPSAGLHPGAFDRASIMLYRFPDLFYVSNDSQRRPLGNGEDLSQEDIKGLKYLYPTDTATVQQVVEQANKLTGEVEKLQSISEIKKGQLPSFANFLSVV